MRGRFIISLRNKAGISIFEVFPLNIAKHGQCFNISNYLFCGLFGCEWLQKGYGRVRLLETSLRFLTFIVDRSYK